MNGARPSRYLPNKLRRLRFRLRRRCMGRLPRAKDRAFAMLTTAENELLCRVEGDAPMGRLMRRHWMPAALSEQLREPDGTPVRLRLLGEDLVAFRDTQGRLGVLGESCPHRTASPPP